MTTPFHDYVSLARASDPAFKDIPRSELLSATRAHAKRLWHDVAQRHRDGESGGNVVRLLSQNADEIVRGVLDFALYHQPRRGPFAPRFALCALGGYGREELNPCSDLDVCLVYQGRLSKSIESLNAYFVPFLWDLGFRAGTAVHRISDASLLAANDPEVFTTFSQARMLAGDSRIFARLQMRMDAVKARGARHVMAYIMRRSNTAHLPDDYRDLFSPEPDIKQNIGGLRDFHAAQWLFLLTHGTVSVDALTTLGVLKPESQLELLDALDFVWRLRNELHFHTGKAQDKLSFALQKHVADAFEYGRTGQVPVDRLMQDYYAAARRLRQFLITAVHLCDRQPASPARASLREGQSPVSVRDGRLYLHQQDPHWFAEHPARLIEVFWQATRRKVLLSPATERLVRQNLHLVNEAFRSNDLVRHFFVAICNRPAQAGAILRQMHECGLLSAYLPEFAAIEDIVRYEDFHHYPVDEHTLRAIEALAQIPAMTGSVAGVLQRTFEQLSSPYLLVLAILFHDLGKAGGEEHVEEGARLSQHLCQRMGLRTDETDRIVFLVRNHLLMTHISMYRDTDDWHTVHRFAETMKSDERLRELLLLSYADLSAVGPNVWNDWKGSLLIKLFLKAERAILGRTQAVEEEYWNLPKGQEVASHLPVPLQEQVVPFLRSLEERYFFAFSPRQIAVHLECLAAAQETGCAVRFLKAEDSDMTEAVICTRDKLGLFAEIAGSFASQLVDINSASLFTRADGWVVDCFLVSDASQRRPLTQAQSRGVEQVLWSVLMEGAALEPLVESSRRRLFALLQPRLPVRTIISFDNKSSQTDSVIDVETGDRTGLLYDIARALAATETDLLSAKIITDARRVRDAFYVRRRGGKIEHEEEQAAVREALEEAIHVRPLAEAKGGHV